jgi:hypothetical protein
MLALGVFFLVWLKLRPVAPPPPDVVAGDEARE